MGSQWDHNETTTHACLTAEVQEGTAAAGDSSAEAGPSSSSGGPGGMRLYLSQIREWIVEFSCDMLFISMRTDVAWYRLSQYVPILLSGPFPQQSM